MTEVQEAALCYLEKGIAVLPLKTQTKKPVASQLNYVNRPITERQVTEQFTQGLNIAGFTGVLSSNLLVIDIDNPRLFQQTREKVWTQEQNRRFDEIEHSTAVQSTPSSRYEPGRRQIFVRTKEPLQTCNYNSMFGYELRAQSRAGSPNYCALPPSLVMLKTGQQGLYAWQTDIQTTPIVEVRLSDLDFLEPKVLDPEDFQDRLRPYGLSWKFYEMLRFGSYEKYGFTPHGNRGRSGNYSSATRSEAEYQAVLRLIRAGMSKSEVLDVFDGIACEKTKYRELPAHLRSKYIARAYDDAQGWLEANPSEIDVFVTEHWNAALELKNGVNLAATHRALLTIARRCNKLTLGASMREIAELAGITVKTAHKHIERLYALGYIDKTCSSRQRTATMTLKPVQKGNILLTSPRFKRMLPFCTDKNDPKCQFLGHDLFRARGLGKNGYLLWQELKKQARTPDELVELCKVSRRTVFYKLKLLQQAGLVVSEAGRWQLVSDDLDSAAKKLHVAGIGAKQRLQHFMERLEHRRRMFGDRA